MCSCWEGQSDVVKSSWKFFIWWIIFWVSCGARALWNYGRVVFVAADTNTWLKSVLSPQVLCPWRYGPAVRAGSHLDLRSAAHPQRDHPHGLSVHHHQHLPGDVHLHLPLRPLQKGDMLAGPLFLCLHLFIQHSSCQWDSETVPKEHKCFVKPHDGYKDVFHGHI